MAISGSFKQQCPSCDANVPIKDASLIGKKVDCPKCKFRFVVEDPTAKGKKAAAAGGKSKKPAEVDEEDVVEAEEPAPAKSRPAGKGAPPKKARDEDSDDEPVAPKSKGKKAAAGTNTKLLIGLGLGGVGLVLLAICAVLILMFGGSDNKPPPPPQVAGTKANVLPQKVADEEVPAPDPKKGGKGGKPPAKGTKGGKDAKGKDAKADEKESAADDTPVPTATGRPAGPENTNFLPPGSEVVYHSRFKDFLDSPVGHKNLFEPPVGPFKDADFYKKLGFSVVKIDDILTAESFTENWTFHVVHTTQVINDLRPLVQAMDLHPWKDKTTRYTCYEVPPHSAAWVLTMAKMPLFIPAHVLAAQPLNANKEPFLLHLRNPQTLVFAHKKPMLEFLQVDGAFPIPPGSAQTGTYLTVKPSLRDMLLRVETKGATDKVLFSTATELRTAKLNNPDSEFNGNIMYRTRPFWDVVGLLHETTDRIEHAGMSLIMKDQFTYIFNNFLTCNTSAEAQQLQTDLHDNVGPQVVHFFSKAVGHKVELFTEPKNAKAPVGFQKPPPPASRIKVNQLDNNVDFVMDLVLVSASSPPGPATSNLKTAIQLAALGLRGEADIASGHDYRFDLGEAGKALGKSGLPKQKVPPETFPPGAFPRPAGLIRASREPGQRVGWMAGLLPYLGEKHLFESIKFDKSWTDGDNWASAQTVVPPFLDPSYPLSSRFVGTPGMPMQCAATHFVGIGGIGADAAEAALGDKSMAGKLGVFGYERMTPLKMIAENGRGLANTVLMVRVPFDGPSGTTPWIAGGGSTVRSVPDKNSLEPFLSTDSKGEQGTYVVMVDGSVRYLKKGMSDEVFKTICTVDGPKPAEWKFDEQYPALKAPKDVAAAPLGAKSIPPPPGANKTVAAAPPPKGAPAPKGAKGVAGGWKEYTIAEGGFAIKMPDGATELAINNIKGYLLEDKDEKKGFMAGFARLPKAPDKAGVDQAFEGAKSSLVASGGFQIKSEKPITFGTKPGYPGREYELQDKDGDPGHARMYLIRDRVIMLVAGAPGMTTDSQEFKDFFDSLRITSAK
jgi:hypothetical protein